MSAIPKRDERALVEAAQLGEEAATHDLYMESLPKLRRAAMYFLGRDHPDIEDVIQETWIVASRKIDEFEFRASIFTWLNHICVNLCYKRIRKTGREIAIEADELDMISRKAAQLRFAETEEDAIKKRQLWIIRQVVGEMPRQCRDTVNWRDLQGLSYGEMAKKAGLTIGAIHARVSRCRKRLKARVLEYLEGHDE